MDTYADVSTTVTGSGGRCHTRVLRNVDKNLGLKTFLNGGLVSDIIVDTSAAATDTIDYVATSGALIQVNRGLSW